MQRDELGAEPLSIALPRDSDAPAIARRWAVAVTANVIDGDRQGDLELLVSELVSNAVLHGTGEVRLVLRRDGNCVRAEVSDESPDVPTRLAATGSHGGFGVRLLAQLAESWGVHRHDNGSDGDGGVPAGKTVWFRI
jgi:serine/threonine-protein kinase RsbW